MAMHRNRAWWNADDRDVRKNPHQTLWALVTAMVADQAQRYRTMRRLQAIYEYGFEGSDSPVTNSRRLLERNLNFNAAQNGIDTVHAQIVTPRVAPMPLTSGGTWSQREAARMMGRALEGEFSENVEEAVTEDVVLDGLVVGLGAAKVFERHGRCAIERTSPIDLYVDEAEAANRAPRCLYQRAYVDRYVAAECYVAGDGLFGSEASREAAILKAPVAKRKDYPSTTAASDAIEIWEAWHLPSGPGASDGRWAICCEGGTLAYVEFGCEQFPFAFFVPKRPREGWWGIAAMRNYAAAQRAFEKMGRGLQRSNEMAGTHILAHRNAKVNEREISNGKGTLVEWEGQVEPREWNPAPANPQSYDWWQTLARMALEFDGTSQYAAQSSIPAGLSQASGKALQKFEDVDNKRKVVFHRARERFVVDLSHRVIDVWKGLVERDPSYSVRHTDKNGFTRLRIKDVLLDDFVIRIFPVSQLSQNPSAKFAQLEQLLNVGAITTEQFKRLYEIPDLESETDVDCADYEIIDKNLDFMVMKGKPITAEPFDNLDLILKRGAKYYNYCRRVEVPEERLELVRRYIDSATQMKARLAAAAPQPTAPAAPAMPVPMNPAMASAAAPQPIPAAVPQPGGPMM